MFAEASGEHTPGDTFAGASQKEAKLLITFLFVLFFFQYGRKIMLAQEINMYDIMVTTVLVLLWYGMSLSLA